MIGNNIAEAFNAAFVVPSSSITRQPQLASSFVLYAEPKPSSSSNDDKKKDDEEEFDLNLEEMFTMFDAASKDQKFDDAIDKVKKSTSK